MRGLTKEQNNEHQRQHDPDHRRNQRHRPGLAEAFHARDNRVIILGRRQDRLDDITATHPGMRGIALDVRDSVAIEVLAQRLRDEEPKLNVLINNAGISRQQRLTPGDSDLAVTRDIVETNIMSVVHATAAFLPQLAAQSRSTIITTTSGVAFVPRANFPTYCASKAFLHSWLQSLRVQMRGSSVEMLELAPPYVQTELAGEHQLTDPRAMSLDAFITEVMALLEKVSFRMERSSWNASGVSAMPSGPATLIGVLPFSMVEIVVPQQVRPNGLRIGFNDRGAME